MAEENGLNTYPWAYVLEAVVAVQPLLLIVCDSRLRRSANRHLRLAVWLVTVLSGNVRSYVMGSLPAGEVDYLTLQYFWAVHLLMLDMLGTTSSRGLEDDEHWKEDLANYLLDVANAVCFALSGDFGVIQYAAFLSLFLLGGPRMWLMISARRHASLDSGLGKRAKRVADHMQYALVGAGGTDTVSCTDPVDLRGYHYLVMGEDKHPLNVGKGGYLWKLHGEEGEGIVTVDMVWRCPGRLLNERDGGQSEEWRRRLKDMCLSFALCKLLIRQLAGFGRAECHPEFVLSKLLGPSLPHDRVERTFRVAEMEMAFLYDSLYTTYPVFFAHRWSLILHVLVSLAVVASYAAAAFPLSLETSDATPSYRIQYALTLLAVGVAILAGILELLAVIMPDWGKVVLLCSYVRKPHWQDSQLADAAVGFMCRLAFRRRTWQGKLGQYSLLYPSRWLFSRLCPGTWPFDTVHRALLTSNGRRARVQVPIEVKEEVFRTLKHVAGDGGGRLTNGKSVLRRGGVSARGELISWAFDFETASHTHPILVWHVATTLCELDPAMANGAASSPRVNVACCLSRYLAYLTACAPIFIPDPPYTRKFLVEEASLEADEITRGCDSMESIYHRLMGLDVSAGRTIVVTGAKLGRILIRQMEEAERWGVLVDFWTEMLLYVAQHDAGAAHAEHLTQGGEFISHVWALLSHTHVRIGGEPGDGSPASSVD